MTKRCKAFHNQNRDCSATAPVLISAHAQGPAYRITTEIMCERVHNSIDKICNQSYNE